MLSYLAVLSLLASPTDVRPPLQIWMNNDRRFREGERVRLQVDADVEGYLLVLNYDTDGRLRVLFPLDPRDDALVHAGRRYEVRGDEGSGAFRAGADGTGLIYSAIARDPWRLDEIVVNDRWDYSRLVIDRDSDNPEQALTDLLQSLAGPGGFDYDLAGYRVYGSTTSSYSYGDYGVRGPVYVYDDYLYCNDWYWRFSGCRRWPYDGGWSFGFSYYNPYRYGYGYGYYPFYYPSYPRGGYSRNVVVGRPRNYTVFPRSGPGTGSYGGVRGPSRSVSPPLNWRPRSVARPADGGGREVSRGSQEGRAFVPPARRSGGGDRGTFYPPQRGRGGDERGASRPDNGPRSSGGGRSYDPPRAREPRAEPRAEPRHAEPPRSSGGDRSGNRGNGNSNGGGHSGRPRHP